MEKRIITLTTIILTIIAGSLYAQDSKESKGIEFDVSGDLVSRYVWRGTQFGGDSPSIQPGVSIKTKHLEAGIWGSYSLGGVNSAQEFDYYLSYTFADEMFTLMFTDYYFPTEGVDYKYFNYTDTLTGHILEGTFKFNGTENIPVTFIAAVNFYGADAISLHDDPSRTDFNTRSGIQYSTYIELGYNTTIKETDINTFIGFNLNSVKKADANNGFVGENGFYGTTFGVVNMGFTGSKEINITNDFSLPVSASVIVNPMSEKVYFVLGISL